MSISKPCALAALLLSLLIVAPVAEAAAAPETPGVTFAASTDAAGELADGLGAVEYSPVQISEDGRYVAFLSASQNLGAAGPAEVAEGFVKDLDTGAVELVTRGPGPLGEPAASGVTQMVLSGDGRHVAFTTEATNLGTPLSAAQEGPHVYERDLDTGIVALVDRVGGPDGEILARGAEGNAISADGGVVAFTDRVANLEDPAGDHAETGEPVGYVRETASGRTVAVGRADGAAGALGDSGTENLSLSPDGRFATFMSRARNLGGATDGTMQVYLRDIAAGATTLVSRNVAGEPSDAGSYGGSLAGGTGCFGVLESTASNLILPRPAPVGEATYVFDRCSPAASIELVSVEEDGRPFPVSFGSYQATSDTADGREAFFRGQPGGSCGCHLYLRDLDAGTTALLDRATGAGGAVANQGVQFFAVAANGCRVAFATAATNLVAATPAGAGEETSEVFVRQLGPCVEEPNPARRPGGSAGDGGGSAGRAATAGPAAPASATRIGILRLSRRHLRLLFDGPGRVRARVQKAVGGRRHGWHLVKASTLDAASAGAYDLRLPALPAGRYRIKVRLQGDPDNPTLTRRFASSP